MTSNERSTEDLGIAPDFGGNLVGSISESAQLTNNLAEFGYAELTNLRDRQPLMVGKPDIGNECARISTEDGTVYSVAILSSIEDRDVFLVVPYGSDTFASQAPVLDIEESHTFVLGGEIDEVHVDQSELTVLHVMNERGTGLVVEILDKQIAEMDDHLADLIDMSSDSADARESAGLTRFRRQVRRRNIVDEFGLRIDIAAPTSNVTGSATPTKNDTL